MENRKDILIEAFSRLKTEAVEKERTIHTNLRDAKAKIILDSVVGQLSDGLWENSPAMVKYWRDIEIGKVGDEVVINVTKYGPFNGKPDAAVLAWFGNKIKQIIKQEIAYGAPNMKWDRTCVVKSDYLSRGKGKEVVVKDAYRVYDALLGRKQRVTESLASENPNYGISVEKFLDNCFVQGGNWTKMLMTGIQNLFPEYYEQMPDKNYSFEDIVNILNNDLGINTSEKTQAKIEEKMIKESSDTDIETIISDIEDELGTEIDFYEKDNKLEFNYIYFLGGKESPIVTEVIKKAIAKVKTMSKSLVEYCTNITADTYAVEGNMYGLHFVCEVNPDLLDDSDYLDESKSSIKTESENVTKIPHSKTSGLEEQSLTESDKVMNDLTKSDKESVQNFIDSIAETKYEEDGDSLLYAYGTKVREEIKQQLITKLKEVFPNKTYNVFVTIKTEYSRSRMGQITKSKFTQISYKVNDKMEENNKGVDKNKPILKENVSIPMVIYKDLDGYKVTPKSNYEARIQDARKIQTAKDFDSAQEIIDYYVKYFKSSPEDFTIVESMVEATGQGNIQKALTGRDLMDKVLQDGFIYLDTGETVYVVTQVSDKTFHNITPKLKKQLTDEGLYDNAYIGFMCSTYSIVDGKYSIHYLPIYGNPNEYVTKWFSSDPMRIVQNDLRARSMGLLKRANDYINTNTQSKNEGMKLKEDCNDYQMLSKLYSHRKEFKDINKESGNIRDLIDDLENKGIEYDVLENCPKGGCTVFYDDVEPLHESIRNKKVTPTNTFKQLKESESFRRYELRAMEDAKIDPATIESVVKTFYGMVFLKQKDGKYIAIYKEKKFPVPRTTMEAIKPLSQNEIGDITKFYSVSGPRLVNFFKATILPNILEDFHENELYTSKEVNDGKIYGTRYELTELGRALAAAGADVYSKVPRDDLYYWGS